MTHPCHKDQLILLQINIKTHIKMENTKMEALKIIGIAVRTTNENGQAAKDIPEIWNRFMTEEVLERIPNKVNTNIYSIYTDYESDYMKPYTTIIGCQVSSFDHLPEGFVTKTIDVGNYAKFTTKGDLHQNIVYNQWVDIWEMDEKLNRAYVADFEIYGEKSKDINNAEVDIYVSVK